MAESVREEAKRKRAGARERRQSLTSESFEALDAAADDAGNEGVQQATAKRLARTAAAAAIAGAMSGAAKALVERRRRRTQDEGGPRESEQEAARDDDQPRSRVDLEQPENVADDDDDEETSLADAEPEAEGDQQDVRRGRARRATDSGEPQHGASDVAAVVDRARNHVENVLGKQAESISGISRGNGSWSVTVEVVDVHRVPDSTDILSSYEVVLDDDGDLVGLERIGRYRRSQVEEER